MVIIDRATCIGCGKCVRDCVSGRITLSDGKAVITDDCMLCGHCVALCPTGAVCIPEYDMADVEEHLEELCPPDPDVLLHTIKFRRSIRNYLPQEIEQEKLDALIQAGRYSATAVNCQGSHFIVVQKEMAAFRSMLWNDLAELFAGDPEDIPEKIRPFEAFLTRYQQDPSQDRLLYNAPCVIIIASERPWDAGLASQNMELMAVSQGLGMLYNGYMVRILNQDARLRKWLGIGDLPVSTCMLCGYPAVSYARTAPRKPADVIWK